MIGVIASSLRYRSSNYILGVDYSVDKIQRQSVPFSIILNTNGAGSFFWELTNAYDESSVATSTSKNPTFNISDIGRYDVMSILTGKNTLSRHQRAMITVLPDVTAYDYLLDLDAIMDTKGSNFTNSATVSAVAGSTSLTTSAAHGVAVNDWFRLAYGASFYQAQAGTTGTTLVLDRAYEGITETVANATTRNFGHEVTHNSPAVTYLFDGDAVDTGSYPTSALLDKLGADTGVTVRIRAGYKIAIKGEFLGYMNIKNWVGTQDEPVHFYNIGKVRFFGKYYNLPYPIEMNGKMQHIVWDGKADSDYEYGIELYTHPTQQGQAWILGGRWNTGLIVTGVDIPFTGADSAGAFGYDTVFTSHSNTVATGASGASTLTLTNALTTIPASGKLVIHTVGTTYAAGTSHYYTYSSFNAGTKVFTLTGTLSQTYTAGMTVEVNICSDYNWFCDYLWRVGNRISATNGGSDEGNYDGFNNTGTQTNGFTSSKIKEAKIYRNDWESTGRDGVQTTYCQPNLEIHDNIVKNSGMKNDFNHTSGISFNDSNTGMVFRNRLITSKEMSVMQTGKYGGDCYFFANVWDTKDWALDAGAVESLFLAIETGLSLKDYHFFNNTIVTDQRPAFTIQHNDAANAQSLNFTLAGNIIIQEGTQTNYTELKVNTSPAGGRAGWLVDNILGRFDDYSTIHFTDYDGKDYTLASRASVAFGAGFDVPTRLPSLPDWAFRDIDGYNTLITRETITDRTAGAYSGQELWVIPDTDPPTLSAFFVDNAHPDRIYFTTDEPITVSGTSGFTLTGTSKTITGATIVNSSTGYFQLSGNISIGNTITIAYDGSNVWKDISAAENELASFGATSVDNQLVLIDFRTLIDVGNSFVTTTDDLGRTWNTISSFNQNTLYRPLNDTTGIESPVTLYVTQNLNNTASGTMGNSGQNASSPGYPSSVWRDYHSGGNTTTAAFELRNLPSTHQYDIRVSGSRAASDSNRVDEVRVQSNGTWSSWVTVDCQTNTTLFADFVGCIADSNSKILIEVRAKSPSTFAYIGLIDVNAIVI